MSITFAAYKHSCIGFPGVVLKWTTENGIDWSPGYVTVRGIIQEWVWTWRELHPSPFAQSEMDRFDEWVRQNYADDASVQG